MDSNFRTKIYLKLISCLFSFGKIIYFDYFSYSNI